MATTPDEIPRNADSLILSFVAVVVSAAVAGVLTGVHWHTAGLLIGPAYWGLYLAALAAALLSGKRSVGLGMLAALLIALPAFFGLAVIGSFPDAP